MGNVRATGVINGRQEAEEGQTIRKLNEANSGGAIYI